MTQLIQSNIPVVSVVLSVLNGGQLLMKAVESIRQQTFSDWELLLIDDGSTDGMLEKIKSIEDVRIKILVDGFNKGLAARLNQGVSLARGKYIARMDADDICFPERFERQVAFLEGHPEIDLTGTGIVVFRSDSFCLWSEPVTTHDKICGKMWSGIALAHPSWMGRAQWFRRFPYHMPEYVRAEDQELLLRAMSKSRYACLPEALLAYRQGGFNLAKIQLARRSLLKAQVGYFLGAKQWWFALLSLVAYVFKSFIDIIAAIPGLDRFYFARMGDSAPPEIVAKLKLLEAI